MASDSLIDFNSPPGPTRDKNRSKAVPDTLVAAPCLLETPLDVTSQQSKFDNKFFQTKKKQIPTENCEKDGESNMPQISSLDAVFKMPLSPFGVEKQPSSPFVAQSTSFEIGRESMPFNIGSLDPSDFGRPSLFANQTLNFGKESLGILNLSARESIGLLNMSSGKESLGILHHLPELSCGLTTDLNTPTILLSDITSDSVSSVPSYMNEAFLVPRSVRESVSSLSSVSSFGSLKPGFNSQSYNTSDMSKICSVGSMSSRGSRKDPLNEAFQNSHEFLNKLRFSEASSISSIGSVGDCGSVPAVVKNSPVLGDIRARIFSLPTNLDCRNGKATQEHNEAYFHSMIRKGAQKFWSAEKVKKIVPLQRRSFYGQLDFTEEAEDSNFNDSVFIEANHLASKFAKGEEVDDDDGVLDTTAPPELCDVDGDQKEDEPQPKPDKETVFKTVTKLFPTLPDPNSDLKFSFKLKNRASAAKCNMSNTSNTSNKEPSTNITNGSQSSDKDNSGDNSRKSNMSKSKDAKDLLHNLSEILNNTNKSEQQKSEGQLLLHSLASILTQSPDHLGSISMEDSGHASFNLIDAENDMNAANVDKHECYEVLDLRTSRSRSESDLADGSCKDVAAPLDLSKLRNEESNNRRLSQSFNLPMNKNVPLKLNSSVQYQTSLELNKNNSKTSVNGSVSSNDSRGFSSTSRTSLSMFKMKKSTESASIAKKGPLRAVMPIERMAKQKCEDQSNLKVPNVVQISNVIPSIVTPTKTDEAVTSSFQNEKTSTPLHHKSKMKPMAQSTPDAHPKTKLSYKPRNSSGLKPSPGLCLSSSALLSTGTATKRSSTGGLVKDKTKSNSISVQSKDSRLSTTMRGARKSSLPLQRRYSVSEVKKTVEPGAHMKQKRSNSIGKDSGVMSALSRVRENITNSPYFKEKLTSNTATEGGEPLSSILNEKPRASRIATVKPVRKYGKENKEA